MNRMTWKLALLLSLPAGAALAGDIVADRVRDDVSKADPRAAYWAKVRAETVTLMGQPMIAPRPATTTTSDVKVQALHDGKYIAFRLTWKDGEKNEAGRLGEFSDAVALEFPVKDDPLPPVMMGAKDMPVHIFHWRAQYQHDREHGKPTMQDLYPRMSVDAYPMELPESVPAPVGMPHDKDTFNPGRAVGNPQAFSKTGVDEVMAEGFATSSVVSGSDSRGTGVWANGEWSVVIARPLTTYGGSSLQPGGKSWVAFAVWQGGKDEVGSRKSLTMMWTPVVVK